jgi:hypothetical protein
VVLTNTQRRFALPFTYIQFHIISCSLPTFFQSSLNSHNIFFVPTNQNYNPCFAGTWDYLSINHYTTFFTYQSDKGEFIFKDTGVAHIRDDKYATAASGWLQVSKQGNAKLICVCISFFTLLEIHFFGMIASTVLCSVYIDSDILHYVS